MRVTRVFALASIGIVLLVQGLATAPGAQASLRSTASAAPASPGYWLMTGYGSSYAYNAPYLGSPETAGNDTCVNQSAVPYACVGLSALASGQAYWIASALTDTLSVPGSTTYYAILSGEGATGSCPSGSTSEVSHIAAPVVGVAAAAQGAWLAASDGGVFGFCGAPYVGSMGGKTLNAPIVGIAPTPSGGGFWLVASDGGVFAFGNASFYGSTGALKLNKPIVGMASTHDGAGYWLVASDGGVFAFGDAVFSGSMGGMHLHAPMVGIASNPDGTGYWTVSADGGVFAFGDAPYLGSASGQILDAPIVGIAARG
jgi:hypothetical protein